MVPLRRGLFLALHAACALACLATWHGRAPAPGGAARATPPPARWVLTRRSDHSLSVRDLASRRELIAPNPLPRLGPRAVAPGFNPNVWAIADTHRIKVISLQTGEAIANFEAPVAGVDRICWLDDDHLAVVPPGETPWLTYRLSTGKRHSSCAPPE